MKSYCIKGCTPSIIKGLCEPVSVSEEGNGIYKFNELPVMVVRNNSKYDVFTCDRTALGEIVQRHLRRADVNLEIQTMTFG